MLHLVIKDSNNLCKQKKYFILRNRSKSASPPILSSELIAKNTIISKNITTGFSRIKSLGYHYSLFYDTMLSASRVMFFDFKSCSAHNLKQIIKSINLIKPTYIIISPIFFTNTHPDAKPLGVVNLFKIINSVDYDNFIILGGITEKRFKMVKKFDLKNKIKGYAGISFFNKTSS